MEKKNFETDSGKRVLEVRLTKLEASLIKKLREFEFGQFSLVVYKVKGQPIRIEKAEINESFILSEKDGLDLDGAVYVLDEIKQD